jgi:RNA polymerase sigma factor (sigma-70 family)
VNVPATDPATSLHDDTDVTLVRRCLDGDQESWAILIDKYKNLIYSIPIKHGLSQEESTEVFQATCVELMVRLPKLRDPQALAAWLIKVALTKTREIARGAARMLHVDESENSLAALYEGPSPEEIVHEVEQEQIVRQAIAAMTSRCKKLITMLFYESPAVPYAELASRLGIATGSIGFIRARCLEKLRTRLEELGLR